MIRSASVALAMLALASAAQAAERQLVIGDQDYMVWSNVGPVMDRCVGAMTLRRDPAACADLAGFLGEFAGKVRNAPAAAAAAPPPAPQPSSTPDPQ